MKLKRIINDLDSGLPMLLGFSSGAKASIPDGNGGNYTARSGPTWFVPRELGGTCDKTFVTHYRLQVVTLC